MSLQVYYALIILPDCYVMDHAYITQIKAIFYYHLILSSVGDKLISKAYNIEN